MKRILFSIIGLLFVASLSFAQISNNWTSTIKAKHLPVGATVPTVAALASPITKTVTFNLDAVTYDNATETTAWSAIGAATKTMIDSNYVVEVFGLNPADDITMRTVIVNVDRRFDNFTPGDRPMQYTAATDVFYMTVRCEWIVNPL